MLKAVMVESETEGQSAPAVLGANWKKLSAAGRGSTESHSPFSSMSFSVQFTPYSLIGTYAKVLPSAFSMARVILL